MTQEEKSLLLKDLCARLPYKARGRFSLACDSHSFIYFDCLTLNIVDRFVNSQKSYWDEIGAIQLYLRPMSSMTEEEVKELSILYGLKDILSIKITDEYIEVVVDDGVCSTKIRTIWYDEIISSIEIFDWLNAHHFDYRGLIEKGLAIKAPEGMYN